MLNTEIISNYVLSVTSLINHVFQPRPLQLIHLNITRYNRNWITLPEYFMIGSVIIINAEGRFYSALAS